MGDRVHILIWHREGWVVLNEESRDEESNGSGIPLSCLGFPFSANSSQTPIPSCPKAQGRVNPFDGDSPPSHSQPVA